MTARRFLAAAALSAVLAVDAAPLAGQWVRENEQFYLPASHNWVFRKHYPAADRLFNAFDYGHAILYEELWRHPDRAPARLEGREYDFVTRQLLTNPPRLPLEEAAIEVQYAKLAPEAKLMFEWAHLLHRQIYDVLADERLSQAEKDAGVEELVRYYKSRPDLAFSSVPKTMELMEGQPYSTAFREGMPKFNGLIWAYHWLQVGLYEPLVAGRTVEERQTGVTAAVTRFRQMLENAPTNMPRVMPMTPAIAPEFARRYPEAAIIFDNLHGMHDVISDILASPRVPRERKRAEILLAARRYRDATSFVMTPDEWREMSLAMGVQNMGGPVTGFLAGFPTPTVERGAVMAHGAGGHAGHDATPAAAGAEHEGMDHGAAPPAAAGAHDGHGTPAPASAAEGTDGMRRMMRIHERMMADPVIRERVATDPVLQGMMREMHGGATTSAAPPGAAADSARAIDFAVRLLSDPAVEARVHADPELHRMWSDPEVQRRLAELRARRATPSRAPTPTPAAAPAHQH